MHDVQVLGYLEFREGFGDPSRNHGVFVTLGPKYKSNEDPAWFSILENNVTVVLGEFVSIVLVLGPSGLETREAFSKPWKLTGSQILGSGLSGKLYAEGTCVSKLLVGTGKTTKNIRILPNILPNIAFPLYIGPWNILMFMWSFRLPFKSHFSPHIRVPVRVILGLETNGCLFTLMFEGCCLHKISELESFGSWHCGGHSIKLVCCLKGPLPRHARQSEAQAQ